MLAGTISGTLNLVHGTSWKDLRWTSWLSGCQQESGGESTQGGCWRRAVTFSGSRSLWWWGRHRSHLQYPTTPHIFACCARMCYVCDFCAWRTWRHYGKIPSRAKENKAWLIAWVPGNYLAEQCRRLWGAVCPCLQLLLCSGEACAELARKLLDCSL